MKYKTMTILVALCLTSLAAIANAQRYKITDLGALSPSAINTWGQVVGTVNDHAYMWTKTTGLRSLGTLQGGTFSRPTAINDLGMVAGTADGPATLDVYYYDSESGQQIYEKVVCSIQQAFAWSRSRGMQGLGVITVASNDLSHYYFLYGCNIATPISYATGVNVKGEVVGINEWLSETYRFPIMWTASRGLEAVTPDASYFQARVSAINNLGQFAGATNSGNMFVDGGSHAAIWENGTITDLGTLGTIDPSDPNFREYCSEAFSINDAGQLVGWSTTEIAQVSWCHSSPAHAALWTGGHIQDLGVLPGDSSSVAYKINLFGQVIGSSGAELYMEDSRTHMYRIDGRPFIWSQRNGMHDLNTLIPSNLGWVLNSATDINVWGQIVGSGMRNGQPHGFLLTPKTLF